MNIKNVFIDFEIVKKSNILELIKELDILIASGKKIYLWSKTDHPLKMRNFCQKTKIPINKDEYEKHKRAFQMRKEEKKTYQEIAKITGLNVKNLGFYLNFDPGVPWVLSDWIKDYYQKDSSVYEKVDFIVDPDSKVVERFQKRGIGGRILQSL